MQHRVPTHRQAAEVGGRELEVLHQAVQIVRGDLLGVGFPVFRHLRWRVPAGVVGDDLVPAGKDPHLRIPAPAVPGELVDEDERGAPPMDLVVEPHTVDPRFRHPPTSRFCQGEIVPGRTPPLPDPERLNPPAGGHGSSWHGSNRKDTSDRS